jgi:hypothetical protein
MKELHHSDIVTYALDRLAVQYKSNPQEALRGLRRSIVDSSQSLVNQFVMESRTQKPLLPPDASNTPEILSAEEETQATDKTNG